MTWLVLPWVLLRKSQLLTPSNVKEGDFLIGLPSSGLHSNGYSLVRNIFLRNIRLKTTDKLPELAPKNVRGRIINTNKKIYVKELLPLLKSRTRAWGCAYYWRRVFLEKSTKNVFLPH